MLKYLVSYPISSDHQFLDLALENACLSPPNLEIVTVNPLTVLFDKSIEIAAKNQDTEILDLLLKYSEKNTISFERSC